MTTNERAIQFTQYMRPLGTPKPVWIDRPIRVADLADAIIARGFKFECEHLTTGEASLTITSKDRDEVIKVVPNGPEVPIVIDRMIEQFAKKIRISV